MRTRGGRLSFHSCASPSMSSYHTYLLWYVRYPLEDWETGGPDALTLCFSHAHSLQRKGDFTVSSCVSYQCDIKMWRSASCPKSSCTPWRPRYRDKRTRVFHPRRKRKRFLPYSPPSSGYHYPSSTGVTPRRLRYTRRIEALGESATAK